MASVDEINKVHRFFRFLTLHLPFTVSFMIRPLLGSGDYSFQRLKILCLKENLCGERAEGKESISIGQVLRSAVR